MQKKSLNLIVLFFLFLSPIRIICQEIQQKKLMKYVGIEAGSVFYGSEFSNADLIRKQSQYNYPSNSYNNTTMSNQYFGVKAEFIIKEFNLGINTGIRYSSLNSQSGNIDCDENNDFFYFLFKENETSVEYLRLRGIKNNISYLGIPFETRYFFHISEKLRLYGKASIELQYMLNSRSEVSFLNEEMKKYKNDVSHKFNDPNELFSSVYFSGGIHFGTEENINFSLEGIFLSVLLTEKNSIINNALNGGGFQINIQIPF